MTTTNDSFLREKGCITHGRKDDTGFPLAQRAVRHETDLNGYKTQRLANMSNVTFHGIESEALLILLDKEDICASSGSARFADSDEPSHVIQVMKLDSASSRQVIRFSLLDGNSWEDIHLALATIQQVTGVLRS